LPPFYLLWDFSLALRFARRGYSIAQTSDAVEKLNSIQPFRNDFQTCPKPSNSGCKNVLQ
jgi:hypothetical protein